MAHEENDIFVIHVIISLKICSHKVTIHRARLHSNLLFDVTNLNYAYQ